MFINSISINDKTLFEQYLKNTRHQSSGLTFTSLFMWKNLNDFKFEIINDFLCICGNSHLEYPKVAPFLFPPLPKNGVYDKQLLSETLDIIHDHFKEKGHSLNIRLIPFHMIPPFDECKPDFFTFLNDRENYDYVYYVEDLIQLSGRKYHSKRNHLNYFLSHYDYEFLPFDSSMTEECLSLNEKITDNKTLNKKEKLLIDMEEEALKEAFYNFDVAGFIGGVIKVNGQIEAFSLGCELDEDTLCVHIEKANSEFRGIYQVMNNEFCKNFADSYTYINREEDMGLPGLRKAKSSYRPMGFTKKYIGCLKDEIKK